MGKVKRLLKKLAVLDSDIHLYQIGCTALLLNVHAQQQRAFNLVWALQRAGHIKEGVSVGIIGGGISGLTAATAILACGAKVHLYESMRGLMHLQQGNLTRFLHPNLALWPEKGFGYPITHMPFMNWRAGSSGDVVEQLKTQWEPLATRATKSGHLKILTNAKVKFVQPKRKNIQVVYELFPDKYAKLMPAARHEHLLEEMLTEIQQPEPIQKENTHAVVIVASGYGIEKPRFGSTPSYWRNDDFAQPVLGGKNRKRYLVSGTGDGGLIDVLRLTLKEFQHQRFIQQVMYKQPLIDLAKDLLHQMADGTDATAEHVWNDFYIKSIALGSNEQIVLDEIFNEFIRDDTLVVLNSTRNCPFLSPSQILHRLAVATLLRKKRIRHAPGELKNVFADRENAEFVALISKPGSNPSQAFTPHYERVDVVVERHNADPTLPHIIGKDGRNVFNKLRESWRNEERKGVDISLVPTPLGYLADNFMRYHHEQSYEIGIALNGRDPKIILQSFLKSLNLPDNSASWNPGTEYKKGKSISFRVADHEFLHPFSGVVRLANGQQNNAEGTLTQSMQCLIFRTDRRKYLERALSFEPDYHFYRVFISPSANDFVFDVGKLNIRPWAWLINLTASDKCFEVQSTGCNDTPHGGMYLAHRLLRVPTILEILANRWPRTKLDGMGWALTRTQQVLFEHARGNQLLQWDNHTAWWLPDKR